MAQKRSYVQSVPFGIVYTFAFLGLLALVPLQLQAQAPCETALETPGDVIDLDPLDPVIIQQGVSEWESEIVKIKASRPGVLSLGTDADKADGSLQTLGTSGLELVNGAPLRPADPLLTVIVPDEVYCLHVDPRTGTTGDLEVEMELIDLCQLVPSPDDHGDSFACATRIELEDEPTGSISSGDADVFAFSLEAETDVEMQTDGAIDTTGRLYDETGALLGSDEDGGPGSGFLISDTLPAGSYFVRVESSNNASGTYTFSLNEVP